MNKSLSILLQRIPKVSSYFSVHRPLSITFNFQKKIFLKSQNLNEFNQLQIVRCLADSKLVNKDTKSDANVKPQKAKRLKKQLKAKVEEQNNAFKLVALSTAESYDLTSLKRKILNEGVYEVVELDDSDSDRDCLCLKAKYKATLAQNNEDRIVFVFNDGACVFWNIEDPLEQNSLIQAIQTCAFSLYDEDLVKSEVEMLTYSNDDAINQTKLHKNHINFADRSKDTLLEKYTFSDAISTSIKLGILEYKLENFIEKIEHIAEDLKSGHKLKIKSQEVLQKTGELFAMRHLINLRFDLLNTPDFYWDRDKLEHLYLSTHSFLDVSKRTSLFNEKLNYCLDLMRILESNLNDKKHTRLEQFIIILIMIEAFFGILSFITK